MLRFLDDLPEEEVARTLGCSVCTVTSRTSLRKAHGPLWTNGQPVPGRGPALRPYWSYLFSSAAFFSTSSIPPQRKNACSGRWS